MNSRCIPVLHRLLDAVAILGIFTAVSASAQTVTVVNMVPVTSSNEVQDDSEPDLSVDSVNPLQIAASAFTPPDPGAPANTAPIYLSNNGGVTWTHSNIIPMIANNQCVFNTTCDITLGFSPNSAGGSNGSGMLFVTWIDKDNASPPNARTNVLRVQPFPVPPTRLVGLQNINRTDTTFVDQPFLQTGNHLGIDTVYIGENDLGADTTNHGSGFTASVDQALDADSTQTAPFNGPFSAEVRNTCGLDGPSVRPAVHPSGTVYLAFFRWTNCPLSGPNNTADVVVVRDDNWGAGLAGAGSYKTLVDSDGLVGKRVVTSISIPVLGTLLGIERIGSSLSLAVDPGDKSRVWIAWGDGSPYTLHVQRSLDGGQTWSGDLKVITSATNPALAVNSAGRVAFLYQQFVTPGTCSNGGNAVGGGCWKTQVETTTNGANWAVPVVLANTPNLQATALTPAFGDYDNIVAVGGDFYGVFSAFNIPIVANFPSGVNYQRFNNNGGLFSNAAFTTAVSPSVDPYFFSIKLSPTVTAVTPNSTACGIPSTVTINGTNFLNVQTVTCGSGSVTNLGYSPTQITASVPAALTQAAGTCEMIVNTPEGSSAQPNVTTRTDLFSVTPTVTGVSPKTGPIAGGYEVAVSGACFRDDMQIFFGNNQATRTFDPCPTGSTQCSALCPTGAAVGPVHVVANVGGVSSATTSRDQFSYMGPSIVSIRPSQGPVTGGTKVVISGSGVAPEDLGVFDASFGGVQLHGLECLDAPPGSCGIASPPAASIGPVHITVTAFGVSTTPSPADVFTYVLYPALTDIFWDMFNNCYVVQLDGNAPANAVISLTSSDSSVVLVPATVTAAGGQSACFTLTYLPHPTPETVTITATYQGSSVNMTVPVGASPPLSIAPDSGELTNGQSTNVTVTMNTPAPAGNAVVTLSSANPGALPVQPNVAILADTYMATFTITSHYPGPPTRVTVTATYGNLSASASLILNRRPPCQPRPCPRGSYWNQDTCTCETGLPQ